MKRARTTACVLLAAALPACGGGGPESPRAPRFSVELVSAAPATCDQPCIRFEWVERESLGQDLLKIALRAQAVPGQGISSASGILSGKRAGTFAETSNSLRFERWERGDYFERAGRPVTYEVDAFPDTCCLATWHAGFPTPAAGDRVAGEGTLVVMVFRVREAGNVTLDTDPVSADGLPFPFLFMKGYATEVRIR